MDSIRGIAKEIDTKAVEKINGKATVKNYATTGKNASAIRNYKVKVDSTIISFTKTRNSNPLEIEKGDDILVVGDKTEKTFISSAYYNITKNIIDCISVKSLVIYFCMFLALIFVIAWTLFKIFSSNADVIIYIACAFSVFFCIIFGIIFISGFKTRKFLFHEISKLQHQ